MAVVTLVLVLVGGIIASRYASGVDTHGAQILHYTIKSSLVHTTLPQVGVIPPGSPTTRRPLLVFLHGKGENQESNLVSQMFAALHELGDNAPDIVFPYGGEDSYWHDRADGEWSEYVMREVIPEAIRHMHADPTRIAIGGLSMGGFGSYDLALEHPRAFCAVGGDSAALWRDGSESAAGAFDNAEDFERNNVMTAARLGGSAYRGTSLWLDVGTEDPFRSADTEFVSLLKSDGLNIHFNIWPGGHEPSYWDRHWSSYLPFYANALARCHRTDASLGEIRGVDTESELLGGTGQSEAPIHQALGGGAPPWRHADIPELGPNERAWPKRSPCIGFQSSYRDEILAT